MKYNNEIIQFITLFENLTRAKVKDCFFIEDKLIFIINNGDIKKAVGRNGSNIKRIEAMIKKKIKVVEFNDNITKFIRNFLYPLKPRNIKTENNVVIIGAESVGDKALLIGRNSKNLNNLKNTVKKYFDVAEIKIA